MKNIFWADNYRLEKADELRKRLTEKLGQFSNYKGDALGDYRKWLDKKEIVSEGDDGWPNENFYDENNIKEFIKNNSYASI